MEVKEIYNFKYMLLSPLGRTQIVCVYLSVGVGGEGVLGLGQETLRRNA